MRSASLRTALTGFFLLAGLFFVGTVLAISILVGREVTRIITETEILASEAEGLGDRVTSLRTAVAQVRSYLQGREPQIPEDPRGWIASAEDRAIGAAMALEGIPLEMRLELAGAADLESTVAGLLNESLAEAELGREAEALATAARAEEMSQELASLLLSAQAMALNLVLERETGAARIAGRLRVFAIWWSVFALCVTGLFLRWLHSRFYRPLREVEAGLARIGAGDLETEVKAFRDDEFGRMAEILNSAAQSIRERAQVQADLTRTLSERAGRLMEDSGNEIFIFRDDDLRVVEMNAASLANLQMTEEDVGALTPLDFVVSPKEEDFRLLLVPLREGLLRHLPFFGRHRRGDGTEYPVEGNLQYSGEEDPPVFLAVLRDVSEQHDREERLRQAQKMEAIGQLTGGVAHDFNNLLTVIQGSLDLVDISLPEGDPNRRLIGEAMEATVRGAELTHHLLAYSRKQPLQPRPLDLNRALGEMEDLLRRTLGETVDLRLIRAGGLWNCEADPVQVQTMVLNLVLNARSAMPTGGKLTLETANAHLDQEYAANQGEVAPGQYVMIAISDTGVGMSPETLERAFEPFFTTKEVGEGSGLGLSMVYGFVKQSRGHVRLYSEPGQGTTAKVYLPRFRSAEDDAHQDQEAGEIVPRGTGERILVVEDEPLVLQLACRLLEGFGYFPTGPKSPEFSAEIQSQTCLHRRWVYTDRLTYHLDIS